MYKALCLNFACERGLLLVGRLWRQDSKAHPQQRRCNCLHFLSKSSHTAQLFYRGFKYPSSFFYIILGNALFVLLRAHGVMTTLKNLVNTLSIFVSPASKTTAYCKGTNNIKLDKHNERVTKCNKVQQSPLNSFRAPVLMPVFWKLHCFSVEGRRCKWWKKTFPLSKS